MLHSIINKIVYINGKIEKESLFEINLVGKDIVLYMYKLKFKSHIYSPLKDEFLITRLHKKKLKTFSIIYMYSKIMGETRREKTIQKIYITFICSKYRG